jgi:hypothetical protein
LLFSVADSGAVFAGVIQPGSTDELSAVSGVVRAERPSASPPYNRAVVTRLLQRIYRTKYESDILVFMPFTAELAAVYRDHLKSAAKKVDKTIARADDFFTTEEIISVIWTALLDTKLVIADCTGRNLNVFYELGLAHAIGKSTVIITQNSNDTPFNLCHRRYIKLRVDSTWNEEL